MVPPAQFATVSASFKAFTFDESTGLPAKTPEGEDVSKGQIKKYKKELAKYEKTHNDLVKQSGGNIDAFIADIRAAIAELES